MERELQELQNNTQGWSASLANSKLSAGVREAIETQWSAAIERQQEIEAELSQLAHAGLQAEQLVEPEQVTSRLKRLADVLATNDPTRGNLELALHIDRIICFRDNRVSLRMCKLGIMPDAVEFLTTPDVKLSEEVAAKPAGSRAARRGKLRVVEDDAEVDLRASGELRSRRRSFRRPRRRVVLGQRVHHSPVLLLGVGERRDGLSAAAVDAPVVRATGRPVRRHVSHDRGSNSLLLKAHPDQRDEVCPARAEVSDGRSSTSERWPKKSACCGSTAGRKEKLAEKFGCSAPTVQQSDRLRAYARRRPDDADGGRGPSDKVATAVGCTTRACRWKPLPAL